MFCFSQSHKCVSFSERKTATAATTETDLGQQQRGYYQPVEQFHNRRCWQRGGQRRGRERHRRPAATTDGYSNDDVAAAAAATGRQPETDGGRGA